MHHDFDDILHSSTHTREKTYAVLHRHWFDLFVRFLPIGLFLIVATVGIVILHGALLAAGQTQFIAVLYFLLSFFYLIGWMAGFAIWVDYFLDIWVVTSGRVINVEQKGFFARDTSELDYTHVQDVTSEVSGFFQTMLNYGDVVVQTAGTQGRFLFRRVPYPEKVKTLVIHLNRQAIAKHAHPGSIENERRNHGYALEEISPEEFKQYATAPHPAENQTHS